MKNIEKVLDEDKSLVEQIRTLYRESGITKLSIFTALSMTISEYLLTIKSVFGGEGDPATSAITHKIPEANSSFRVK